MYYRPRYLPCITHAKTGSLTANTCTLKRLRIRQVVRMRETSRTTATAHLKSLIYYVSTSSKIYKVLLKIDIIILQEGRIADICCL